LCFGKRRDDTRDAVARKCPILCMQVVVGSEVECCLGSPHAAGAAQRLPRRGWGPFAANAKRRRMYRGQGLTAAAPGHFEVTHAMSFSRVLTVCLGLTVCVLCGLALRQSVARGEDAPVPAAAPAVDYVKDVKPILAAH